MVAINTWSSSAALSLLSFLPTTLLAQGSWQQTPTIGDPGALAGHAAAYDTLRERMVMFGGHVPTFAAQAATWEFDGVTWSSTTPANSPPPRMSHAMAFDAARGRVVMFGGSVNILGTSNLDDTWEYDGQAWIQRLVPASPQPRAGHAMAYDMLRGKVVLHGGRLPGSVMAGDTWEWDGNAWVSFPSGGPAARYGQSLGFDLIRGRTVMFGGFDGQTSLGDTWEWDGLDWHQQQSANSPSARSGCAMAYDISRSVTVLHGGIPGGNETWEWDGNDWTQHGPTGSAKTNHTLVYEARLQRTTLYGGMVTSASMSLVNEVEVYGHAVPGSYSPLGSSCAGSVSTPTLVAAPAVMTGPLIGETSVVQVIPSWFHTFFALGWSDTLDGATPLPYDLSAYGMPGCSLQVSRDAITSSIPTNGVSSLSIPIPNDPFLVSVGFFVQGFALDLGANAGGFTTTNRLVATIGRT